MHFAIPLGKIYVLGMKPCKYVESCKVQLLVYGSYHFQFTGNFTFSLRIKNKCYNSIVERVWKIIVNWLIIFRLKKRRLNISCQFYKADPFYTSLAMWTLGILISSLRFQNFITCQ